ncbi:MULTISPECIES: STAS domain-containing protein [Pseudomonas]|uniref:STAS domain-containing protein n=1 Tax=Pseudomonas TaxID=286 RepID=UPI0008C6397A|nr:MULTISPECIES: STAS domain-containing protein [Pseudomonas]SEO23755.1 anti-anti-sigma factor [Pseudomonas sp. NFACC39-1]SFH28227.1 anti-anti-sigma factor [Pseudomonas sp. NFACC45]
MSVVTEVSPDGQKLTISIKGRFDFGRHQEFRESYERLNQKPESIVVDLKEATYLDSSALGMLLLLRDHAGGEDSDIRIVNSNSDVKKILAISNFDKLFDIYPKEDAGKDSAGEKDKPQAGHLQDKLHPGKA